MTTNGSTTPTGKAWIHEFAARLGVAPPSEAEFEALLDIAGVAAHASERIAAPIACFLTGKSGRSLSEAAEIAASIDGEATLWADPIG